jgi:hypothetical protein
MAVHDEGAFWSIFGYLLSGLVIWGGLGHFVDRWMGTHLFFPCGLLLGISSAFYLIWMRFIKAK